MMKKDLHSSLLGFHVKNFKCFEDTGYIKLTKHGLYTIIGQNESGKSSLLDALLAFSEGQVHEDQIRNDAFPVEILCSFSPSSTLEEAFVGDLKKAYNSLSQIDILFSQENNSGKYEIRNSKIAQAVNEDVCEKNEKISAQIKSLLEKSERSEAELVAQEKKTIQLKKYENYPSQHSGRRNFDVALKNRNRLREELSGFNEELEILQERLNDGTQDILELILRGLPKFIMYNDFISFLPHQISTDDIGSDNVDGSSGNRNFIATMNIEIEELLQMEDAKFDDSIEQINKTFTSRFNEFWMQLVDKKPLKVDVEFGIRDRGSDPYITYLFKEGNRRLKPSQRSKGAQWYLSFLLQLVQIQSGGSILLIDEPGCHLHINAQLNLLELLNRERKKYQIFMTTHNPHLVHLDNLANVIAVEKRKIRGAARLESRVLPGHSIGKANKSTLIPIYANMGSPFHLQNVIGEGFNVVLEEISALYYYKAFQKLLGVKEKYNFFPCTGVDNIKYVVPLFVGWNVDYVCLFDNDVQGQKLTKKIKKEVFSDMNTLASKYLMMLPSEKSIEDLFSKSDYKKWIIKENEDYESSNSEYARKQKRSKGIDANNFLIQVRDEKVDKNMLEKETLEAFYEVFKSLKARFL